MRTIVKATTLALAAGLLGPAVARAHVTVQPSSAPAGGFVRLDVRVPTERDGVSTAKVEVKFPPGFAEASYQPVPGWTVKVAKAKLATPVQTDDGPVTEGVDTITWTAERKADGIPSGAFQDFGLSVAVPGKAGDTLTFKALQTYSDGQIVRWIGPAGSENPAPVVDVTASGGAGAASPASAAAPAATAKASDDGGSGNGLAIAALVVGVVALVAGGAALVAARRASGGVGVGS